ncbi:magnesium chelatase domain-containing protein [Nocardia colli]|nr:magnesium chelatase domain-containing protein [Nocardia colli]
MTRAVAWSVALRGQVAEPFSVTAVLGSAAPVDTGHAQETPECRDRVRAALLNSGRPWPHTAVQLSMNGAPQPSAIADLAVAVAVLAASGQCRSILLPKVLFVAELGLDGSLRQVEGTWAAFDAAPLLGFTHAVVPQSVLPEFGPATALTAVGAPTLTEVLYWLHGTHELPCAGTHRWDL